ncbi:MAG: ABC transporter transmembrane domain-containing protein [Pseudomonadota bacterium]
MLTSAALRGGDRLERVSGTARKDVPNSLSLRSLGQHGIPYTDLLRVPISVSVAALTINMLGLLLPIAILQVYDRVIPNASQETLVVLIAILIAAAFGEAALRTARAYLLGWNAAKFSHNISVEAVHRLLNAPHNSVWREPPNKVLERLEAVSQLGGFYGGTVRQIWIDLPFAALFIVVIGIIGGLLVIVPIILLLLFGTATFIYGARLRDTLARKDEHSTRTLDFISQALRGISTVKGQAMDAFMARRFERLSVTSASLTHDLITASDRAQIMAGMLGNVTIVSIATVGAVLAAHDQMTIGTLAACSMLSGRAVQPFLRVAGVWNELQRTRIALSDAAAVFALPRRQTKSALQCAVHAPDIEIDRMTFRNDGATGGWSELSLRIDPGDIACFCGGDGVGKSSLLRLLAGHTEPQEGEVRIDGVSALEYRQDFSNSTGYVSPDTTVFNGTILENLTLFGNGCTVEEAVATVASLGLERDISLLPEGYETVLGGAASEAMPRGFIKRLLIARALATEPRLLILDEAQAYLDPASDLRLRERLLDLKFRSTIVMATNRPEYQALANKIFDMTPGEIVLRSAKPKSEP